MIRSPSNCKGQPTGRQRESSSAQPRNPRARPRTWPGFSVFGGTALKLARRHMSKRKPRVKKSHYVPQAYLRQFANDERLYVCDKAQRRYYGSHIKDVCSERDFYECEGLEDVTGPDYRVEDLFHGFEDAGARVIRDTVEAIRQGAFTELPKSQRLDLALFLAMQHLRTKRMREVAGQLMESISKESFLAHIRRTQPDLPMEDSWISISADERARTAAQFWLVADEDVRVVGAGARKSTR